MQPNPMDRMSYDGYFRMANALRGEIPSQETVFANPADSKVYINWVKSNKDFVKNSPAHSELYLRVVNEAKEGRLPKVLRNLSTKAGWKIGFHALRGANPLQKAIEQWRIDPEKSDQLSTALNNAKKDERNALIRNYIGTGALTSEQILDIASLTEIDLSDLFKELGRVVMNRLGNQLIKEIGSNSEMIRKLSSGEISNQDGAATNEATQVFNDSYNSFKLLLLFPEEDVDRFLHRALKLPESGVTQEVLAIFCACDDVGSKDSIAFGENRKMAVKHLDLRHQQDMVELIVNNDTITGSIGTLIKEFPKAFVPKAFQALSADQANKFLTTSITTDTPGYTWTRTLFEDAEIRETLNSSGVLKIMLSKMSPDQIHALLELPVNLPYHYQLFNDLPAATRWDLLTRTTDSGNLEIASLDSPGYISFTGLQDRLQKVSSQPVMQPLVNAQSLWQKRQDEALTEEFV